MQISLFWELLKQQLRWSEAIVHSKLMMMSHLKVKDEVPKLMMMSHLKGKDDVPKLTVRSHLKGKDDVPKLKMRFHLNNKDEVPLNNLSYIFQALRRYVSSPLTTHTQSPAWRFSAITKVSGI